LRTAPLGSLNAQPIVRLTNSTPRKLHATWAAGWDRQEEWSARRQRQYMVAQEPRPTVNRTSSMAFPGRRNHLHPAHPANVLGGKEGTPIAGGPSFLLQRKRGWPVAV